MRPRLNRLYYTTFLFTCQLIFLACERRSEKRNFQPIFTSGNKAENKNRFLRAAVARRNYKKSGKLNAGRRRFRRRFGGIKKLMRRRIPRSAFPLPFARLP
jgi:hypothetical protein